VLGDWRGSGATPVAPESPPPTSAVPALVRIDMPGSGQSGVIVAAPFVPSGASERRIGQVASAVLGGGYSARLNQKVRIERGLSYGASSQAESQPTGGVMVAVAQTQHSTAAEVLGLIRAEIAGIAAAPPPVEELAARQATLTGSFARRMTTTGGLAALMVGQYAQGRALDDLRRYVDEIMAVTPEQVRDFARQRWAREALRAVVVGDLKAAGPALDEADALTVPLTALDLELPGLTPAR
jgi:zinc protease